MHSVTRSDVEDFLFAEADLLDQWRLPEWLTLFTDDAKYEVPCTDLPPDASPDTNLFYIADDYVRLLRAAVARHLGPIAVTPKQTQIAVPEPVRRFG